jgi:threonine/homoserine/homoserine lactone efflux protein
MRELFNGLLTGLTLQLAIGPVFFFIVNLTLQKTIVDGLAGVLAVTLVDYIYITLSIIGIGKLLKNKKIKRMFGFISSLVLMMFGFVIIRGVIGTTFNSITVVASNTLTSFTSVFAMTISSPMTIVFFTSLFTAKAIEYSYSRNELVLFGLGTGLATFLFMGLSVILFSLIRGIIPTVLIQILNGVVGCLLIGYGGLRLWKSTKEKNKK